jgi:hypothetical protein
MCQIIYRVYRCFVCRLCQFDRAATSRSLSNTLLGRLLRTCLPHQVQYSRLHSQWKLHRVLSTLRSSFAHEHYNEGSYNTDNIMPCHFLDTPTMPNLHVHFTVKSPFGVIIVNMIAPKTVRSPVVLFSATASAMRTIKNPGQLRIAKLP